MPDLKKFPKDVFEILHSQEWVCMYVCMDKRKNSFAVADREAQVQVRLDSCHLVEDVANW